MATGSRNLMRRISILPPAVAMFLYRRLLEATGAVLVLLALALAAALLSYNPADPSLNTAADNSVTNILGIIGAWAADFLIPLIGLAAWLLPLVAFAWGWRLSTHQAIAHPWLRLVLFPLTVLMAAAALAGIVHPLCHSTEPLANFNPCRTPDPVFCHEAEATQR